MRDISKQSDLLDYIKNAAPTGVLSSFWIGRQSYNKIWKLQRELHNYVVSGTIGDIVLLLEHPHVYTLGKNADSNHLLPSYNNFYAFNIFKIHATCIRGQSR